MFGSGIIILGFLIAGSLYAQRGSAAATKNRFSAFSEPPNPQHREHGGSQ
jgi:hypothetical protein